MSRASKETSGQLSCHQTKYCCAICRGFRTAEIQYCFGNIQAIKYCTFSAALLKLVLVAIRSSTVLYFSKTFSSSLWATRKMFNIFNRNFPLFEESEYKDINSNDEESDWSKCDSVDESNEDGAAPLSAYYFRAPKKSSH